MNLRSNSDNKNYKMNIYKAGSHKTDTFFVQQMKVSLKTVSIKRPHDFNEKNNFNEKSIQIFLLKVLLDIIRIFFLPITFLDFF